MPQVIKSVSNLNDSLISFLENPIIKYGFLILVVLQIITINKMSIAYLSIFNDNVFKVVYAFIIAYYACFDPVYAIALTTLMIIAIQELHSRNATDSNISSNIISNIKNSISNTPNKLAPSSIKGLDSKHNKCSNNSKIYDNKQYGCKDLKNNSLSYDNIMKSKQIVGKLLDNDELVYKLINEHSLQKIPDANDKLTAEYDFCQGTEFKEPAYQTMTANINSNGKNYCLEKDIYNNSPDSSTQGLPIGYDSKNSMISNSQAIRSKL